MSMSCGQVQGRVVAQVSGVDATAFVNEHLHDLNLPVFGCPVKWTEAMVISEEETRDDRRGERRVSHLPLVHIVGRVVQPDPDLEPVSFPTPVKDILHGLSSGHEKSMGLKGVSKEMRVSLSVFGCLLRNDALSRLRLIPTSIKSHLQNFFTAFPTYTHSNHLKRSSLFMRTSFFEMRDRKETHALSFSIYFISCQVGYGESSAGPSSSFFGGGFPFPLRPTFAFPFPHPVHF